MVVMVNATGGRNTAFVNFELDIIWIRLPRRLYYRNRTAAVQAAEPTFTALSRSEHDVGSVCERAKLIG